MPARSSACAAFFPMTPLLVTSMRMRWLSVPPVMSVNPRSRSSAARARALVTIWWAYSWKAGAAASVRATPRGAAGGVGGGPRGGGGALAEGLEVDRAGVGGGPGHDDAGALAAALLPQQVVVDQVGLRVDGV